MSYLSKWVILVTGLLLGVSAEARPIKVCLTGTLVKIFPKYGEAFHRGALLNLDERTASIDRHYYNQNAMAPRKAMINMIDAGCHAILGFSFTNDLLAIRDLAEKHRILVISMYGGLNEELSKHPTIRTMQIPAQQLIGKLVKFASDRLAVKWKRPIVVTTVDRESMVAYRTALDAHLGREAKRIVRVNSLEGNFDAGTVVKRYIEDPKSTDAIVLFTRSKNAAIATDSIYRASASKKPPVILGTKFFGSSALPAYRNMLKDKNAVAYIARQNTLSDPDPAYASFVSRYRKRYKSDPMVISGLVNDAIEFVSKCRKKASIHPKSTAPAIRAEILKAANSIEHAGISGVKIGRNLRFQYTKAFIVKVDKNGYNIVKSGRK